MNCCNEYGECNQGRNCPIRKEIIEQVAKVGKRMHGPQALQEGMWRHWVRRAAYWLLMAVLGLTVWPVLIYLVLRLS
jgi:ketopantoate reductase